jgi:pSer/pThr/pTyr-binding forkhead associated (FHA) protein
MAHVTIQVLEGFERGRVFAELPTPITIGREEDNTIQLNDERVSRFHVKIQEDGGRIILTDLESTNGTRVNGHPVQMRVLQFGDHLTIGRSLLLYGSSEQIEASVRQATENAESREEDQLKTVPTAAPVRNPAGKPGGWRADEEFQELFPNGPPEVPTDLKMAQMAQLSDLLAYVHDEIARLIDTAAETDQEGPAAMRIDREPWQRLLKFEMQIASYLRQIANP